MTERSYFFDGTTIGDSQLAPYTADLYASVIDKLFGSEISFVISATSGYFNVTTTGADMVITVAAGNAVVQGRHFVCTNTTITVPLNTSSLPRLDRVVIRIDKTAHTGTLALKQGVPGYAPQPAVLTRTDDIYEMSVARIYVPAGITALNNYNVVDEREFFGALTGITPALSDANSNIMPNSEFIAGAGTNFDTAPAMWTVIATATCTSASKFDQMARGSSVRVACPATGDGIQTVVDRLADTDAIYYTVRLLIDVVSGEVNVNTGGTSVGSRIPPTGGPVEVIVRRAMSSTYRDMTISITNTSAGASEFILGQVTLSPGDVGAPYLPKKEFILFGKPVTQMAYPTAFSSSGTTEYDLVSELDGVSALVTRLDVSDGSSGTNNTNLVSLQDIANDADQLRVEIGRLTNAGVSGAQGFVGAPYDANGEQKLQLLVTRVATTSVGIYHLGCIT